MNGLARHTWIVIVLAALAVVAAHVAGFRVLRAHAGLPAVVIVAIVAIIILNHLGAVAWLTSRLRLRSRSEQD